MNQIISKGWKLKKLEEFCEINPTKSEIKELDDSTLVSFVPMRYVDDEKGMIVQKDDRKLGEVRKGYTYFRNNDVIFAKITPCMENGKAAIGRQLTNGIGFASTEFHVLRPNHEAIPEWIYYFVRNVSFRNEAKTHFTGSAGQQRVPVDFLKSHEIPLPSIETQNRIIKKLDYILGQIEKKKKIIQSFNNFKKLYKSESLLIQMIFDGLISGKLTQNWRKKNGIVKEWDARLLDSLTVDSKNGKTGTPKDEPPGIPRLGITTITQQVSGYVNESECKFLQVLQSDVDRYSVVNGDILFCRQNGNKEFVGKCAVYRGNTKPLIFSDSLIRFRVKLPEILPEFLVIFTSSTKGRMAIEQFCATTAGNYSINSSNLKQIQIDLPTVKEQEEIIRLKNEHIEKIDNMKKVIEKFLTTKEKVLSNLESIPNSILNTTFSGKLVN